MGILFEAHHNQQTFTESIYRSSNKVLLYILINIIQSSSFSFSFSARTARTGFWGSAGFCCQYQCGRFTSSYGFTFIRGRGLQEVWYLINRRSEI